MHARHAVATTLLAGAERHGLPVRYTPLGARIIEAHHAVLARQRHDRGHTQFGRLLHDPVHALGAYQALQQRHRNRGLALDGLMRTHVHLDALTVEGEHLSLELPAAPVKEREGGTCAQPQYLRDVGRGCARQPQCALALQRGGHIAAGQAHAGSSYDSYE